MAEEESAARIKRLTQECVELVRAIIVARREMAKLHDPALREVHLPRASEEINAILRMTEEATNEIMRSAEEMMELDFTDPDGAQEQVNDACMRIFEACSFQDITGQRNSSVLRTLQLVESKIEQLESAWGGAVEAQQDMPAAPGNEDERLLNGPSLEGEGIEQDFVDKLFAAGPA